MENRKLVRAEVNVLRLPWFVLDRHTQQTAITASGSYEVDGQRHEWSLSASPSARWGWPGPLARKAHMALLGIATERGREITNPITWRWPDLCDRMGVKDNGNIRRKIENSLLAIHGLTVVSESAVYDAVSRKPVAAGREGTHLFDRVQFLQRGGCDTNAVCLSEWYVNNLNAAWTRRLDGDLWRRLDDVSHIASRLYEYLLYGKKHELLDIGYTTLASYLPLKKYKEVWRAKDQLDGSLALLVKENVLADAPRWGEKRADCVAMLHLTRGAAIRGLPDVPTLPEPQSVTVQTETPAELLLREWGKRENAAKPNRNDVQAARSLIEKHGQERAKRVVAALIERADRYYPDCRHLNLACNEFEEAVVKGIEERERQERARREQAEQTRKNLADENTEKAAKARLDTAWKLVWRLLGAERWREARAQAKRQCSSLTGSFLEQAMRSLLLAGYGSARVYVEEEEGALWLKLRAADDWACVLCGQASRPQ